MPWKETGVMEQRIEFVARALGGNESVSGLCKEFDISRPTGYLWLNRYDECRSFTGLNERSRRPKRSPTRVSSEYEQRVVELRKAHGWGGKKISHVLKRDEGIELAERTANRVLKRKGLINPEDIHRPATGRFEREKPNELWQMDFKGQYPVDEGSCYPLSILDDHSRFAVGLYALTRPNLETVQDRLVETFRDYGVPEAMLMDHGTPWWSTSNGHGLTRLSVDVIKQGIKLLLSGIRHPQTQGKVERFHRTLAQAMAHGGKLQNLPQWSRALDQFRWNYNQVRPHEALQMQVPAEKYEPSSRPYNPNPEAWIYPAGATLRKLNTQGCMEYRRRRYFVCEALASEPVWIREIDGKLLVTYRHMYIREVDLMTGHTLPLVKPL